MTRIFRAFVLVLVSGAYMAHPQTSPSPAASMSSAEQAVRRLNTEEVDAFLHSNPADMARLWSDDFVVTNPLNRFVTKQQVLGMVKSGFLVITAYERRIEYIRAYGDTMIVAGSENVTWGGKMPNAGKVEQLRFTGVWMKQGGRWQQVARHANVVPQH
jgi:ketosteroid isomerase-like protein